MISDDRGRVPFAAIGVLLIVLSTLSAAYLMKMESSGLSRAISDDRERDLSKALTLASADIGSALNYAGLYAQEEVGRTPIVNVSEGSPFQGTPEEANLERMKYIAFSRLLRYLEANYNGSYSFGDYGVTATAIGDYRSLEVVPGNMTLCRNFDHPVAGCAKNYTSYYSISAPVRIVLHQGDEVLYHEDRVIRTLITSRYPLLEGLTEEYGQRLNGTPMFADLTAAAFAYTWARGYAQYTWGEPLNIVDNAHMELIVNGASLMEQGFEYNSVDPMGLAALAYRCFGSDCRPAEVTNYSVANNSRDTLPRNRTAGPPRAYSFNASAMADGAYENVTSGGYARNTYDGAYTACMYLDIKRESDYYSKVNESGVFEDDKRYDLAIRSPGEQRVLTRTFRVCKSNASGEGYADRVTVAYVLSRYSALQYFGSGRFAQSSAGLDDPVLAGSSDDVADPFSQYVYERDLSFGHKAFRDDNLGDIISCYEASFDEYQGQGYFEERLMEIVSDRVAWEAKVPYSFRNKNHEFVCGPDNRRPIWAEIEADYELRDLRDRIGRDISVTLDPHDYGGHPAAMSLAAYRELSDQFSRSYDSYLDREHYVLSGSGSTVYKSCGSKAIFRVRQAFLEDVRRQLDDAAGRSGDAINRTIDRRMKGTGQNSSDLGAHAADAREYLGKNFYIPFGLSMTLNSSPELAAGYPWHEQVTLAVDQRPEYLGTGTFTDPGTGYTCRPLKLRNICLFSVPADFLAGEISGAMAEGLLDGIDAMAGSVQETANETLMAETDRLVEGVASAAREELKKEIREAIGRDGEAGHSISGEDVDRAVDDAFARRDNDPGVIVRDLKDGLIAREIAGDLVSRSTGTAAGEARELAEGYVEEYSSYVARRVEEQVASAGQKAISGVICAMKDEIRVAVTGFSESAAETIAKQGANAALSKALGRIPSGLPLLPPYGWWATMNAWYIEVQGEIPVLTVYDADMEPVPDPIFGHRAMAYTRRHEVVNDENGRKLGFNEPLRFQAKTSTFILVPPGAQGVGDKTGGWDEKSPGFDEQEEFSQ
jgi:hypothetical protein